MVIQVRKVFFGGYLKPLNGGFRLALHFAVERGGFILLNDQIRGMLDDTWRLVLA